ncbi:MAG: DUF1512 domain-containing protein [Candidatus Aenigmarchaeota archaeon]|nr:DUF1512 domain-containing protein [Candidatus Aenigmarchaeota archaeon]
MNGNDPFWNFLSFILFILFMFFYPRLLLSQIVWKLEESAELLESLATNGKKIVTKGLKRKNLDKKLKESLERFLDFFVINPTSLDPYGIVKKFDHILTHEKERFKYFVDRIAPNLSTEEKANIMMGLSASIMLRQLAKIMRHYVELIKKTKNFQLALLIQMNIPQIERMAKALLKGTQALTNGWPVGDGIGCLVAAKLIGKSKVKQIYDETIMAEVRIEGKKCLVVKPKGPGGRLGNPGKAVEKLTKKYRVAKIITIDAALKLEGEKTGSVAEGVGVAMGGPGVEKTYIENVAVKKNIPLDSVIVKMSQEEAITPMKKEIYEALPKVLEIVRENVKSTKGKGVVLIVGVGNTSGIGNSSKDLAATEKILKSIWRKAKQAAS